MNVKAIAASVEINTLIASLGLAFIVDQYGQEVLSALHQETNQSDIVCNMLKAYTSVSSDNTMSSIILNSHYADVSVSLSANRLYTNSHIYSKGMINAFDGFQLSDINGASNYFYIQMDANGDVPHNLVSNAHNINFNIGGTNVGYFSPADGLYVNGGIIFNETGCIGYDAGNNLLIINNYNGGALLTDIDFSINDTIIASFSSNNPLGTDSILNRYAFQFYK